MQLCPACPHIAPEALRCAHRRQRRSANGRGVNGPHSLLIMLASSQPARRSVSSLFADLGVFTYTLLRPCLRSTKRSSRARLSVFIAAIVVASVFLLFRTRPDGFSAPRRRTEITVGTIFSGPLFQRNVIQFRPQDVFLLYTKTPKTSSTFASSMIAGAYVAAGLPVVNSIGGWHSRAKYAAVHHQLDVTPEALKDLEREVGRPVLLVVSTRDGITALQSAAISAQQYDQRKNRTFDCSLLKEPVKYSRRYWEHIQAGLNGTTTRPWAVIRHEHVEEDTCCVLAALGLECQPSLASAHLSSNDLDFSHCVLPEVNASHARQIDAWNEQLMKTRVLKSCSGSTDGPTP